MIGHVDLDDSEGRVGLIKMAPDVPVGGQMGRNVLDQQRPGESNVDILEAERSGELLHPKDSHHEEEKGQDVVGKEKTGPAEG